MTLTTTNLEGLRLVHRGKVRETYEVDDRHLLLVATDRLSAFDVVFEQAIPDKGALLTRLSTWWFGELADLGPHGRDRVQGALTCALHGLLLGHVATHLAGEHQLPVAHRELAGGEHVRAAAHRRDVRRHGRRHLRHSEPELLEALLGGAHPLGRLK